MPPTYMCTYICLLIFNLIDFISFHFVYLVGLLPLVLYKFSHYKKVS